HARGRLLCPEARSRYDAAGASHRLKGKGIAVIDMEVLGVHTSFSSLSIIARHFKHLRSFSLETDVMFPPRQRRQRLGQPQRLQQMQQNPVRRHEANPTPRVARARHWRRGPSPRTQDQQETTTSGPWGYQTLASPSNSGSVHPDLCELQNVDSVSFIRSVRELLDMVKCATVEAATAANIIESMNAKYKTAVWYADHLRSETNGLVVALEAMTIEAMAVEAFATPTMPWDEMAGLS
ncbi:hypothetical protein JMJ78_0000958, partial [Colletotrichum scovillei]